MKNNRTNLDKQLTNQGWSQMEAILDREMPAKKRRRPFILFFWMLGIAILLGTCFWWSTSRDRVEETQKVHEPIANQTNTSQANDLQAEPILNNIQTEKLSKKSLPNLPKTTIDQTIKKPIIENTLSTASTITKSQKEKNQSLTSNNNKHLLSKAKNNISTTKTPLSTSIIQTPTIEKKDIQKTKIAMPSIANLAMEQLPVSILPLDKKVQQFEISNTSKNSNFGIKAGVGHNFNQQANLHLGFTWNRQVNSKFSLETGLHFYHFPKANSLSFSSEDLAFADNAFPEESGAAGGGFPSQTEIDNTSSGIGEDTTLLVSTPPISMDNENFNTNSYRKNNTRQALVLPLQVNYDFKAKWTIFGALQVAYFWDSNLTKNNYAALQGANNETQFGNKGFELWTKAGLRYQATRRVALELGYNRALSPQFIENTLDQRSSEDFFNHHYDFSVLYKF